MLAAGAFGLACVCLAAAEWGARRLDPGYLERVHAGDVARVNVYSEAYGWLPRPGARIVERGAVVTVNARGQRGPEIPLARSTRSRLLVLGDSTAFGYGVADEATFAARVAADARGFEVVNLGVEGYGPDQSLLRFEREGRAYAPDAVVLSLCIDNDFADAGLPVFLYDGAHPKPYFSLDGAGLVLHDAHLRLGRLARIGVRLRERSQLYDRLATLAAPRPRQALAESWRERRARVEGDPARAVELLARIVARLRDSARPARLLVLLQPSKASYNSGSVLADALAARLGADGIETLDLARAFHARGLRFGAFAFDATGHANARGHALVAELLLARLSAPEQHDPQRQRQQRDGHAHLEVLREAQR